MTRGDFRKLIGGYATGSLSAAERQILFQAALDDQELFDELAREQALKEVIEQPGARQRLIAALAMPAKPPGWWRRPWPWAVGATVAVGIAVTTMLVPHPRRGLEVAVIQAPPQAAVESAPPMTEPARPTPPPPAKRDAPPAARKVTPVSPALPAEVQAERRSVQPAGVAGVVAALSSAPQKSATPRFALDYAIESGSRLTIRTHGEGYLLVMSKSAESLDRIFPVTGDGHVLNDSSTEMQIPKAATAVLITFAAQPAGAGTGLDANAVDSLLSRDEASGTVDDPNPSRSSRIVVMLRVPGRE